MSKSKAQAFVEPALRGGFMSELSYSDEDCNTFIHEIERDGRWELRHYVGKFYWRGPAIICEKSEFQEVVRATSIRLQADEFGKTRLVVYPVSHGGEPLEAPENGGASGGHQGAGATTGGVPEAPGPASTPGLLGWPRQWLSRATS